MHKPAQWKFDLLMFTVAGLRDGLGPMLGAFLIKETHFDAVQVATVLGVSGLASMIVQLPIGVAYDKARTPFSMLALGGILTAMGTFWISLKPEYTLAICSQVLAGIGSCLLAVGVPAATVRVVPKDVVSARFARNEVFSKLGNLCCITFIVFATKNFGVSWLFNAIYITVAFLLGSTILNQFTQRLQTHFEEEENESKNTNVWSYALPLLPLLGIVFIYQFADAPMYMVFEQSWVRNQPKGGIDLVASSLQFTQIAIVASSLLIGCFGKSIKTSLMLQIGFAIVILRSLVYMQHPSTWVLYLAQFLDGIVMAILFITPVSFVAAVTKKHFNKMSALLGLVISAGTSTSVVAVGYLLSHSNFAVCYSALLLLALVGLVVTGALLRPPAGRRRLSVATSQ